MGRLEPLPMFLAEDPGLRRGGRVPSSRSRNPHPPPRQARTPLHRPTLTV